MDDETWITHHDRILRKVAEYLELDPHKIRADSFKVNFIGERAQVKWTELSPGRELIQSRYLKVDETRHIKAMVREDNQKEEIRAAYARLVSFTTHYSSAVGKIAEVRLIEWRALMGLQLGEEFFMDGEEGE